jgi:hypothetical protein
VRLRAASGSRSRIPEFLLFVKSRCSGSERRQAGGAIDLVDDAHVDNAFDAIGWKRLCAAYLCDERAQLAGVGSIADNGFPSYPTDIIERDLIAVMRGNRVEAITAEADQTKSRRSMTSYPSGLPSKLFRGFQKLGPGIVTGAADDDPSGIATYSQVGAQFGFTMLWTMLLTYPLMAGLQEFSAWLGRVTGVGIAGNVRRHYSPVILCALVALLLIANVINLGADIAAMGSALKMLVGGSALLYAVGFGLISVIAAILVPYERYTQGLKWSALVLFVYVGTAMIVHVPWKPVVMGTFIPSLSFSNSYLTALTAVFGTTISPYLCFWQASLEVQHRRPRRAKNLLRKLQSKLPRSSGGCARTPTLEWHFPTSSPSSLSWIQARPSRSWRHRHSDGSPSGGSAAPAGGRVGLPAL